MIIAMLKVVSVSSERIWLSARMGSAGHPPSRVLLHSQKPAVIASGTPTASR